MTDFTLFLEEGPLRRGLPAFAYTSADFFSQEAASLFPNNWAFLGFAHELRQPGDVVPVTLAGRPLVMLRDEEGGVRVFHNVCRHRCLKLVERPRNVGRLISCPYHAWAYDLTGRLRAAPYFGGRDRTPPPGFDKRAHGLVPARSAVWHDWVFVNLGGKAPDFEDYVAPLAERLEGLDLGAIQPVATLDFGEVKTNWKFLMENFIEPYHVQFVHSKTTDQPLQGHSTFIEGACLGSLYDTDDDKPKKGNGAGKQGNVLSITSRYLTLFPNFIFGFYPPDQIGVYQNLPLSPDRTHQRRVIYHVGQTPLSSAAIKDLSELWTEVHREDHAMCERLQSGRASSVADDGGLLSPAWEDSVRCFQEMVVEAVGGPGGTLASQDHGGIRQ